MTAIVREHLEAVTRLEQREFIPEILAAFSRGLVSREETISTLGLRDYAELLVVLGDHDLSPPRPQEHEIENQAVLFEHLWRAT